MRRLVVCCDGTWNDEGSNSNVWRLSSRLGKADQPAYYDQGVGTGQGAKGALGWLRARWDRWSGGAFGSGLSGNVKEAYQWVAEHYEENDSLWFFGFSRGAFTVRSTVGFIRTVGLLPRPVDQRAVDEAFDLYRQPGDGPDSEAVRAFRTKYRSRPIEDIDIAFVGVWDTVGALGIPGGLLGRISRKRWGFHDYRLSSHVRRAYHALAVDELRAAYLAALWQGPAEASQEVAQRWFPGHHWDIGGSRGDRTLKWIAQKAEDAGLVFEPKVAEWPDRSRRGRRPSVLASRQWRFLCGQAIRPIGDARFVAQEIDESVTTLRESDAKYRPENLEGWLRKEPMENATGRAWWYTVPGANRYYLGQYRVLRR